MMSTVGAELALDTTAALVLGDVWAPTAAGTQVEAAIAYAEIAAVGLLPGAPSKDHCLLTLHFGAAVIGVAIPNADARKLGQTLIAASADDHEPH
jgi:hypothetical protein